ncbi:HEAT repeat-containing protein 6 [Harmonia axyridis]|uniref:HEAT repeat-containing protein 6 n=1 Tax=Harmonia axyridis TaxID=115357 RepID=UPI001E27836B|nr:HEAT repeat-containing protein 6 [Harmonia axyridis]
MAISNDNREIFKNLSTRLSSLFINRTDGDRVFITKNLDDLNMLNFRLPTVENPTDAILLIHNCCLHISHDDSELTPKSCRLITKLINFQKLPLERRTFNDLMNWSLKILSHPDKKYVETLEVLILLDTLVRSSNLAIGHYIFTILHPNSPLFKVLETEDSELVRRYGLQLLEACTAIEETENEQTLDKLKKLMVKCVDIFQMILLKSWKSNDHSDLKIKIICLRGLENIVRKFDNIVDVGYIFGIIKCYMLLGIHCPEYSEIQPILPSSLNIPEPKSNSVREKKGGKVTKLRKHKVSKQMESQSSQVWMKAFPICDLDNNTKIPPLTIMITSDSDLSDSGIPTLKNVSRLQSKVRQMSLSLLFAIAKKLQKAMLTYWTSFIPEYSGSGKLFLTTCILEDPSMECRAAALNVLLHMLTSAKLCLSQADSCARSTAFTSFSAILGSMILKLHECLSLALKDKITSVLAQVLKCYAALIEGTPYHPLSPGLITEIVRNVNPFLQHKDPTIKTGAFIVFGCILASEPVIEETKNLFLKIDMDENEDNSNKDSIEEINPVQNPEREEIDRLPSILQKCLNNLQTTNKENITEQLPVKIESIRVISCMCRNYFESLVFPYLSLIGKAMCDCLLDGSFDLKLHTGRTIDCIGQSMAQFLQESERGDDEKEAVGVSFWLNLLNGPLRTLFISDTDVPLRAVACCCLSSIGSRIFENLSVDKHYLCMTYLLACSRDEEFAIRSAAVRALGILAHYPILKEDPGFIVDVADAIYNTIDDENTDVRVKGSWALGNFSDVLVLNSTNEDLEKFPNILMMKLLEKSVVSANALKNNDKIKANAARAIGNLLHLIDADSFKKPEPKKIVDAAVACLIKTASTVYSVKVRWNSCYALSLLLKNEAVYNDTPNWLGSIFSTLNSLVIDFKNFKVRTTAALALASCSKRSFYGIHYHKTWTSLLRSLENTQHIDDYYEYEHKSRLIEQVCLSLAHLLSLSEIEDLVMMRISLDSYYEICKTQMQRMYEILIPEKSNVIFIAAEHLKTFNDSNLNAETKDALILLQDIIVQEF